MAGTDTTTDPTTGDRRRRVPRTAVAGAAVVGFLVGSMGFAMAGALPAPAQDAASEVLEPLGLDVPKARKDNRGACVSAAVQASPDDDNRAAIEACPAGRDAAPGQSEENAPKDRSDEAPGRSGASTAATDDDPCTGRPPWAGPGDKAAKAEAKAAAGCVDDDAEPGDDDDPGEVDADEDVDDEVVETVEGE